MQPQIDQTTRVVYLGHSPVLNIPGFAGFFVYEE